MELGKTNKFPQGKLTESDEGEIRIAVGIHKGNVIIDFGTPTAWLGLPKEQALALAQGITDKANKL